MTKPKLRTRPYSYEDVAEKLEAAIRLGLRRAGKHDPAWTLTDDQVDRAVESIQREMAITLCEVVAFPR